MKLELKSVVVHPQHGPATVIGKMTRTIKGTPREYVELEIMDQDLTIWVPLDSLEEVGVRNVMCAQSQAEIFEILTQPSPPVEPQWSRRVKDQGERMRTGEPKIIAALIRDMLRRREDDKLSQGEKDMLREAMRPAIAEMAVAMGLEADEAERLIEDAVLRGVVPEAVAA